MRTNGHPLKLQVRQIRLSSDLSEQSKGKTKEGANDPMTKGDVLSHQAMSRSFIKKFPNVQVPTTQFKAYYSLLVECWHSQAPLLDIDN